METLKNILPFYDEIPIRNNCVADYSSTQFMDIFNYMVLSTKNEKYIVNDAKDVFDKIISHPHGGFLSSCKIVLHKQLLKPIERTEKIIGKKSVTYNQYFKRVGIIQKYGNEYEIFYTKKKLKQNMSISIFPQYPFDIWFWDKTFYISTIPPHENNLGFNKKCQIKIYP